VTTHGPEQLVAAARAVGVRDARLLEAIAAVPRRDFVPPELAGRAYADEPLPIAHAQVTTQPSLVAQMVEALALAGGERVLEIGTGYGWQTALLARLAAEVWSVERFADLAAEGRARLDRHGVASVRVVVGDGTEGLSAHAPYDAILVSAAFPEVPAPLVEQLTPSGRLVQPIGPGGAENVTLFVRAEEGLRLVRVITGAHFVPLVGRLGFAP